MTPLLLLDSADRAAGVVLAVGGAVALVAGLIAWMRRQGRMLGALSDAILGQEEVKDRSGAPIRDPQPGLAAQVKDIRDEQIAAAAHVRAIADHAVRISATEGGLSDAIRTLTEHARILTDHAQQIETLTAGAVERIVTRAESVQHLAMLDRATPPATDDPQP